MAIPGSDLAEDGKCRSAYKEGPHPAFARAIFFAVAVIRSLLYWLVWIRQHWSSLYRAVGFLKFLHTALQSSLSGTAATDTIDQPS